MLMTTTLHVTNTNNGTFFLFLLQLFLLSLALSLRGNSQGSTSRMARQLFDPSDLVWYVVFLIPSDWHHLPLTWLCEFEAIPVAVRSRDDQHIVCSHAIDHFLSYPALRGRCQLLEPTSEQSMEGDDWSAFYDRWAIRHIFGHAMGHLLGHPSHWWTDTQGTSRIWPCADDPHYSSHVIRHCCQLRLHELVPSCCPRTNWPCWFAWACSWLPPVHTMTAHISAPMQKTAATLMCYQAARSIEPIYRLTWCVFVPP